MKRQNRILSLLDKLQHKKKYFFPPIGRSVDITCEHGVYIIYLAKRVMHVGRSITGKNGLCQRLKNHLYGQSSFVVNFLNGDGNQLRELYEYQFLVIPDPRDRAYTECLAAVKLCPEYIGTGSKDTIE